MKYQVNPNSVSFKDMEVVGFVRDTAEIWNYNTNNKNWELFNAGQKLYTDGKITVDSYKRRTWYVKLPCKRIGLLLSNLIWTKEQYIH